MSAMKPKGIVVPEGFRKEPLAALHPKVAKQLVNKVGHRIAAESVKFCKPLGDGVVQFNCIWVRPDKHGQKQRKGQPVALAAEFHRKDIEEAKYPVFVVMQLAAEVGMAMAADVLNNDSMIYLNEEQQEQVKIPVWVKK